MSYQHFNPTQKIISPKEFPLLCDESPYFNNLNRYPEISYKYSETINNTFSYGGCVSRLKSTTSDAISLYRLVKILENEVIISAGSYTSNNDRYGIVVAEQDELGFYTVCLFNPNFSYPPDIKTFLDSDIGKYICVDTETFDDNIVNISTTINTSKMLLGKVIGRHSIYFCGTMRLYSIPSNHL